MAKQREEVKPISELRQDPENRRKRTDRGREAIRRSLRVNGAGRSILLDETDTILAGNGVIEQAAEAGFSRVRIIEADGSEIIAVRRRGLTPEQKRDLAIADNRTAELAEWDAERLKLDRDAGLELEPFFSVDELRAIFGEEEPGAEPATKGESLVSRFGVPPFSVLDARQGYWQERKRAWLLLGIESELGRGDATPGGRGENSAWTGKKKRGAHEYSAAATIKRQGGKIGHDGSKLLRAKRKATAEPGGSKMPAANYSKNRARGDGRGRAVPASR